MQRARLVLAATLATFAAGIAFALYSTEGGLRSEQEPILVVLVGDRGSVQTVRAVISDERVVAETPGAFVLAEERIIAANAEAAAEPINLLGWTDREIELVGVAINRSRLPGSTRGRPSATGTGDDDRAGAERIAELMSKPTLNAFEAATLLRHLDSTGQL